MFGVKHQLGCYYGISEEGFNHVQMLELVAHRAARLMQMFEVVFHADVGGDLS